MWCKSTLSERLRALYQKKLLKMRKNWPVMGRLGHSGFDHQLLHQIKGLTKKIDFQQNTTDF